MQVLCPRHLRAAWRCPGQAILARSAWPGAVGGDAGALCGLRHPPRAVADAQPKALAVGVAATCLQSLHVGLQCLLSVGVFDQLS